MYLCTVILFIGTKSPTAAFGNVVFDFVEEEEAVGPSFGGNLFFHDEAAKRFMVVSFAMCFTEVKSSVGRLEPVEGFVVCIEWVSDGAAILEQNN